MPGNLFNLGRYLNKKDPAAQDDSSSTQDPQNQPPQNQADQKDTLPPLPPKEESTFQPKTPSADNQMPENPEENKDQNPQEQKPENVKNEKTEEIKEEKTTDKKDDKTLKVDEKFQKRSSMDILSRLTQRSNKALMAGAGKAKEYKNQYIDSEHVLWGLLQDSGVYQIISNLKVTPTEILKELETKFKKENHEEQPKFSPRVKKILELSLSFARAQGYEFISPEHILYSLSQEGEGLAAQILAKSGLTPEKLKTKVTGKKEKEKKEQKSSVSQFTTDLTQMAREGKLDPVVARSKEIERIMHILSRRTKNNPVLIGDAGVGKTAIVEGLAIRIVEGKVPETLLNKKILSLDLMGVIAGASHRGEFEDRLKKVISEVKAAKGEIILFIDEIHNMVGAGGGGNGAMDASNILKPSLARGEMQTIGITTITEYRKYIEKDPALERRFQPVLIKEPTPEEAIEMLHAIKDKYEAFHKVSIPDETITAAVRLSARYIGDRFLPDKAIDLIDEGASSVRLPAISLPEEITSLESRLKKQEAEFEEAKKQNDQVRLKNLQNNIDEIKEKLEEAKKKYDVKKGQTTSVVTPETIQEIISNWTGIPVSKLTESESAKLVKLEDVIHKRFIDQEEAVGAVSEAIRRGRAGLSSGKRPIGSFVFMGPTGVGKTELAKALAEILFGSEDMTVRLDMTEYMEKHEVAKLIGAPPGYVGYEEGGQLTEAVRRKPYSVVLMDEIEKAHPDVFNILLQVLDDGRLTDNKGRTISFKNTILICTSNIGTGLIQGEMLKESEVGPLVMKAKTSTVNTYTITPTGREIATLGNFIFEKESKKQQQSDVITPLEQSQTDPKDALKPKWIKKPLTEYFAGQKLLGADILNPQEKFPMKQFDTHVVSPSGEEQITLGGRIWKRRSTTSKEWESMNLVDYLKDHQVANAQPDHPEEQLPTAKWETHAISPQEEETITLGDRLWMRPNLQTKEWQVKNIKDYAQGQNLDSWKIHLFKPTGEEMIVSGSDVLVKTAPNQWQKKPLTQVITGENAPVSEATKEEKAAQTESEEKFAALTEKLMEELRKFFRPELLNRFDEIIVFKPLSASHMLAIVDLQFKGLEKLLHDQNLGIEATDAAKEELALVGFDPVYGARPLRRTIQRLVENPISTMLIKGDVKSGDIIEVDFDSEKNEFFFNVKRVTKTPPPAPENQDKAQQQSENQGVLNQKDQTKTTENKADIDAQKDQNQPQANKQAAGMSADMKRADQESQKSNENQASGEAEKKLEEAKRTAEELSRDIANGQTNLGSAKPSFPSQENTSKPTLPSFDDFTSENGQSDSSLDKTSTTA